MRPLIGAISENPNHARLREKLIRPAIAHAHARSHATSGRFRLESKKKNHAAKLQQRNVRAVQPAPPGPGLAKAKANGIRRMAKDPKTRTLSLSRLSARLARAEIINLSVVIMAAGIFGGCG